MIHFDMPPMRSNIIKVLGFGGGGSNAVNHMYKQNIANVDFIICNTDAQSLATSDVPIKIQLGPHLTQGLGAGANPEVGKKATEESLEEIKKMLEVNTKMAFITAGMGGGTGTGGAPTIARVCREMGILTVGIVTTPFGFEGPKRMKHAQLGIEELKKQVDTLLVINNDKLRKQYGNLKMSEAFDKADTVLSTAARCITDIINSTGQINVDFADVCTVMRDGGVAILGNATASGEDRAIRAIEQAITSPLLNDNDISGAKWILLNITSPAGEFEYTMDEVDTIQNFVREQTGEDTDVILGIGYDTNLTNELAVTVIATGFGHKDPFAKPVILVKKVEDEPKEVFLLDELGAKKEIPQVFFATPVVPEEKTTEMATLPQNANPLAPTLSENVPAPNKVEPIQHQEEADPVFMLLQDKYKETTTLSAEPKLVFTEKKTEITLPEALKMELKEEIPATSASTREDLASRISSFLSKPIQVYNAPPEAETMMPFLKEEPKQPEPQKQPEPVMKVEPAFQPEMKLEEKKTEEEASLDFGFVVKEEGSIRPHEFNSQRTAAPQHLDLTEDEEQKRKATERMDKIKKLRNLSFNFNSADPGNEFEQVPAYLRRNTELHNTIANVENFYSRAQVKTDDNNQTSISTINTFLDGKNPD